MFLRTAIVVLCVGSAPLAAMDVRLGVMGDSLSDEYSAASYGTYAQNWVQQLELYAVSEDGEVELGPTAAEAGVGNWGVPRGTGYQYNWARAGDTTSGLLSNGQHTGLAGLIPTECIPYAVMAIGANDFAPGTTVYNSIYGNTWNQTQINNYIAGRISNINTALNTVLPTGVGLVLVTMPDYGVTPAVKASYPNAVGRQRVADVLETVNAQIEQIAIDRRLALADLFGVSEAIFGTHASPNSTLLLGNVSINLGQADTSGGGNPTAGFVHDGIHPNTTLQGLLANLFIEGLNVGYGAGITPFTEAEVLAHRGIAYGGADTLPIDVADYVRNYAPALLTGDVNKDGTVDIFDVGMISDHWMQQGLLGDADGNCMVDIFDVGVVSDNWMATAGTTTAVPEPATAAMLAMGGVTVAGSLLLGRRRKS
jgi:hypothetical protein